MLKRAVIWGYLSLNPAQYIEKPRVERKDRDIFTEEELKTLLEDVRVNDPEYHPLFFAAAITGMRRGELLALKWEDINWEAKQIYIRRSLVLGKLSEPKSKAGTRVIDVGSDLLYVLKKHKLSCPPSELDLVFPNREGKIMDAPQQPR